MDCYCFIGANESMIRKLFAHKNYISMCKFNVLLDHRYFTDTDRAYQRCNTTKMAGWYKKRWRVTKSK